MQNTGNFCYFIMVSSKRHQKHGKAPLQSAFRVAQCANTCCVGQIIDTTSSSSEDTYDEVERQGQSPTFNSSLLQPIISVLFIFFLSLAPRRSRAEHPATDRAVAVVGTVRSAHTRRRKLSIPCVERSTLRFPLIPSSTAQGYLRLD